MSADDQDVDMKSLLVDVRSKLGVVDELKQKMGVVDELKQKMGVVDELKDAVHRNGVVLEEVQRQLKVVAEGHTDLLTRIDRTFDEKVAPLKADIEALKIVQVAQTHDLKAIKADVRVLKGRTSRMNSKIDLVDAKLDLKADKADLLLLMGRLLEPSKTD